MIDRLSTPLSGWRRERGCPLAASPARGAGVGEHQPPHDQVGNGDVGVADRGEERDVDRHQSDEHRPGGRALPPRIVADRAAKERRPRRTQDPLPERPGGGPQLGPGGPTLADGLLDLLHVLAPESETAPDLLDGVDPDRGHGSPRGGRIGDVTFLPIKSGPHCMPPAQDLDALDAVKLQPRDRDTIDFDTNTTEAGYRVNPPSQNQSRTLSHILSFVASFSRRRS